MPVELTPRHQKHASASSVTVEKSLKSSWTISRRFACCCPVAERTTANTSLTSGSRRHSHNTPCPTMPVLPKRTIFTFQLARAVTSGSPRGCRSPEQSEVDGLSHRLVPGVAWMEMIPRIARGEKAVWLSGVSRGRFEIDHSIEHSAGPDPLIHRAPFCVGGKDCRAIHSSDRGERRPVDDQTPFVRTRDELLEAEDHVSHANAVTRVRGRRAAVEVVDSLQHHDMSDAGLHQHVAIESRQRARTRGRREHSIASDARVDHGL